MFSIHQHWDPLQTCVVGRTLPPEYYAWIKLPHVRSLFERMAIETETGSQLLTNKLQELGVQVIRPNVNLQYPTHEKNVFGPPLQPRNHMMMIGDKFYYQNWSTQYWKKYYNTIADASWDRYNSVHDFLAHAPAAHVTEAYDQFNLADEMCFLTHFDDTYGDILDLIKQQGNQTIDWAMSDGGALTRIGQDLYFGTSEQNRDVEQLQAVYDKEFPDYRNHMIDSVGHTDGTFCAVCPGLIVAHDDPNCVIDYARYFPGWEVIYVKDTNLMAANQKKYKEFFKKTKSRWWIPGHEQDQELIATVEASFGSWIGSSGESIFDLNMLVVDEKNVISSVQNTQLIATLEKYGITVHVLDIPHTYFWDGGVHCMTLDLDRRGQKQNYFTDRT